MGIIKFLFETLSLAYLHAQLFYLFWKSSPSDISVHISRYKLLWTNHVVWMTNEKHTDRWTSENTNTNVNVCVCLFCFKSESNEKNFSTYVLGAFATISASASAETRDRRTENESCWLVHLHAGWHSLIHPYTRTRIFCRIIAISCLKTFTVFMFMYSIQFVYSRPQSSSHTTQNTHMHGSNKLFLCFCCYSIEYLTFFFVIFFCTMQLQWCCRVWSEWFVDASCRQNTKQIRRIEQNC